MIHGGPECVRPPCPRRCVPLQVIIGVFMGGVAACIATALLSWGGIAAFEKRMKQQ